MRIDGKEGDPWYGPLDNDAQVNAFLRRSAKPTTIEVYTLTKRLQVDDHGEITEIP